MTGASSSTSAARKHGKTPGNSRADSAKRDRPAAPRATMTTTARSKRPRSMPPDVPSSAQALDLDARQVGITPPSRQQSRCALTAAIWRSLRSVKRGRRLSGDRSLIRALGLKIGKIVIDAGHGGHDTGTIGPNGLLEKDLVLDVAQRLGRLLESRLGAEVIYTRAATTRLFHWRRGRRLPTASRRICSFRFTRTPAAIPMRAGSRPTT